MSKLTQKQEELAKAYILYHGNQSEAWRAQHPDSKATPKTVWEKASKAFSDSKVRARIQELQDMATERHLVTVETIASELGESFEMAKETKQAGAMTGSTVAKAKLFGLMEERSRVTLDAAGDFLKAIQPTTGIPSERDS